MNSQHEIRSLTGLRGVAACFVVVYHYLAIGSGPGFVGTIIKHGYLAVDLFFVLSGFVMAMTYGRYFQGGFELDNYYTFLIKRLARVYPLYIATSAACLILYFADAGAQARLLEPSWFAIGSNALLVQAWGLGDSLNGPGWSISVELFAYILFPALAALLLFGPMRQAVALSIMTAPALFLIAVLAAHSPHDDFRFGPLDLYNGSTAYPLLRCVIEFCYGLVAWRLLSLPRVRHVAASRPAADALCIAVCALLAVQGTDIPVVLVFGPLIMALATGTGRCARILAGGALHRLGVLSYSIYLVHRPILDHVEPRLADALIGWHVPRPHLLSAALLLPCTVLIALLTFRFIERPGRQLAQAVLARRRSGALRIVSGDRRRPV